MSVEPTGSQPRRSMLGRLVSVLGLAFFVVELTVLAVFTWFLWTSLRADRREHLVRYASAVHQQVEAALRRGPVSAAQVDADLDAALKGKTTPAAGPSVTPVLPHAGAPVEVWVFTPRAAYRFTASGQLLSPKESEWTDPIPASVTPFFSSDSVASQMQVERDKIVRVEPLGTSPQGDPAVLYLETSLVDLQRQVASYGLVAFGTGALALLFTAMITIAYLRRTLLVPLSRIISADNVARSAQDDPRALIDEGDIPNDEVGQIMRSRNHLFRGMVQAQQEREKQNQDLAQQREELRRWGRELEALVQDKTAALLRARDTLYRTEKLAAVGRLAANVAHEINNPLASIAGYAEDAREDLGSDAPEDVAHALKVIEEQAFRCKDILKRLLGLARTDAIERAPVAVVSLVSETLDLSEPGARKRGVQLVRSLPDDQGPTVVSDAGSLQQVILNLVENAVDAAVGGSAEPPWVGISLREEPDQVGLVVEDSGPGIPDTVRGHVFDPFYTTKPVGRGTGLGLAICQSLVERLGGRIELAPSRDAAGATFVVWLPRKPTPAAALPNVPGTGTADGSDLLEASVRDAASSADPDA